MRFLAAAIFVVITATTVSQTPVFAQGPAAVTFECGPAGSGYMRTTLYFGLNKKSEGTVSKREWTNFLRDHVTTRFPQGFTVWEADGQWRLATGRIQREQSKVLLIVHDETAAVRVKIAEIIDQYKRSFEQESVLWETARVCASF
jgi:hypothetical protein